MNKIPCEVIKDLIVLYEDDSCSEESRKLVEAHIKECPDCRKIYEESMEPLPEIQTQTATDDRSSPDEKAMKFLKKLKRNHDVQATLIIVLSVIIIWLICTSYTYLSEKIIPAPADAVEVTELYRMKDGSIFCTLESEKAFTSTAITELLAPQDKQLQSYDDGWYEVTLNTAWWKNLSFNTVKHHTASFIFPMTSTLHDDSTGEEITRECKAIYYTWENEKEKLNIWEEGTKLDPAPARIEKLVADDFSNYIDQDNIPDTPEVIFRDLP